MRSIAGILAATGLAFLAAGPVQGRAAPLAKDLFGHKPLPAATAPASHGFYSKGCFSGGIAIADDGPNWQVMRPSRNRRWGHPDLIALIAQLSRDAAGDGWPGLLVGDISQPRGGPMLTGHASHQIGLDADIWLTPMPNRRLTQSEREKLSATSMLNKDSLYVNDAVWTSAHVALLKRAASYGQVERILVHPGIKKKLCDTVKGDRSWLYKIRPFWGHHYHFHLRIGCPAGSPGCKPQSAPSRDEGCDKALAWWFTDEPWRPAKPGTKPKPKARDVMTMASLPAACQGVLDAPAPASAEAVTLTGEGAPGKSAARAPVAASAFTPVIPPLDVPLPRTRPER